MKTLDQVIRQINLGREQAAAQSQIDRQRANILKAERRARQEQIDTFLEACGAVPCTVEAYALWLTVWFAQGGEAPHSFNDRLTDSHRGWLMPTRSTDLPIPTAYGAQALRLIVASEEVSIPRYPTSGDCRSGWEWGHSHVLWFDTGTSAGSARRIARTNYPLLIETFIDVEEYIRRFGQDLLDQNVLPQN
jgi:hypothetical protein